MEDQELHKTQLSKARERLKELKERIVELESILDGTDDKSKPTNEEIIITPAEAA